MQICLQINTKIVFVQHFLQTHDVVLKEFLIYFSSDLHSEEGKAGSYEPQLVSSMPHFIYCLFSDGYELQLFSVPC